MPAGPVIVNSTPLVAFWAIGRLDILHLLFGEIVIPPAVRDEFLSADKETRRKTLRDVSWIRVVELENPNRTGAFATLDEGEAQVIKAALEPQENPLGLRYSFLKQQGNGTVEVDTATAFRSGERIRLTVESNDSAYLYLVLLGSSGKWSVLFPSSQIAGGNNHIEPGHPGGSGSVGHSMIDSVCTHMKLNTLPISW